MSSRDVDAARRYDEGHLGTVERWLAERLYHLARHIKPYPRGRWWRVRYHVEVAANALVNRAIFRGIERFDRA